MNIDDLKTIEGNSENLRKYWDGLENVFKRYTLYLRRGFALFNEAKNYILILFSTYWTIRTMDYWATFNISDLVLMLGLGGIALFGIGILILLGRWDLFKFQPASQFINTQHGDITQFKGFNMTVINTRMMIEIAKKLGVDTEKIINDLK